jgi:hypothetical protein
MVWSDDLERRSVALYLTGEVKPYISMEPGGYVSLWGKRGEVAKESIEITNHHEKPLEIKGVENALPDRIRWRLVEIKEGYAFRLEVEDTSKEPGNYHGQLTLMTSNPRKPRLVVIVMGQITE